MYFPLSYVEDQDQQEDMPFVVPSFALSHESCTVLNQFKFIVGGLPLEVKSLLSQSLVDPFFTRFRQKVGDVSEIPRLHRLILLYQCIKLCKSEQIPRVIAAISIITGLSPDVIVSHNRINLTPVQMKIIETFHKKASVMSFEPVYTFSGRIEVAPMCENLPSTVAWSMDENPFTGIDVPEWIFESKPPEKVREGMTPEQIELLSPLSADQMPESLSPQQKWLLLHPSIRKSLKAPFFFSKDLSNGFNPEHGLPPVPCYNDIDDQKPPPIKWIADLAIPDTIPETYTGCQCGCGNCCECHRFRFRHDQLTMCYTPDGKIDPRELNDHHPLITECNKNCKCNPLECRNRVVQNRSRVQLMVVRSLSKSGWGVRAMEFIPKGSFVCEYLGSVISDPLVAEVMGREYDENLESYLFDLDAYGIDDKDMLTVDPSRVGNVSKYINHSCDPNLVQISIGTVDSELFHRVGFFACRNIYPNEELGFHYNYEFDKDPERFIECNCGCAGCRTRLR